jgi:hypothetical protein
MVRPLFVGGGTLAGRGVRSGQGSALVTPCRWHTTTGMACVAERSPGRVGGSHDQCLPLKDCDQAVSHRAHARVASETSLWRNVSSVSRRVLRSDSAGRSGVARCLISTSV